MPADLITRELLATDWHPSITAAGFLPSFVEVRADIPVAALLRDGAHVGHLVYRVAGREFAVALLAGDSAACGGDLLQEFAPVVEAKARALGCDRLVCTTERPAMLRRLIHRHGWRVQAAVLEKPLPPLSS